MNLQEIINAMEKTQRLYMEKMKVYLQNEEKPVHLRNPLLKNKNYSSKEYIEGRWAECHYWLEQLRQIKD